MTGLEALFIVLNYLALAPVLLVLVVIARQQRVHRRRQKALERSLQQSAKPARAMAAPVAVPASDDAGAGVPVPPWLRANYITPDAYVRAGFDYIIRAGAAPQRVWDQGGFGVIQNRYHSRHGGAFIVQRMIYLN